MAESCEDLSELLDVYADLLGTLKTDARLDVIAQALIQLRFVEKLDGSFGHDLSDYYETEAKRRWAKIPDAAFSLEPLRLDSTVS